MTAQLPPVSLGVAAPEDLPRLRALNEKAGVHKEADYWERCFEKRANAEMDILIARCGGEDIGYGLLNRAPKYALFKKLGLPEIQDLYVLPDFRRRGVATSMMAWCEETARREGHAQIGIGVGLHAGYGPAQRLYIRLGYVPDGTGVSYDRAQIAVGEFRPLDDCLCLMMIKDLE
ncbi:MAG: GNAT family N-acetyltransferase [Alphaproteobacteria bacterium]|nr:GNAT family N-acetyltransferase [Alphaproteobacteria bacterium]